MGMSIKLKLLLWAFNKFESVDLEKISVKGLRKVADNRESRLMDGKPIPLPNVEDRDIRGRDGDIPIRIYTPEKAQGAPVIVFYHGGGFVIGNLKSHDKVCRRLCKMNQAFVVAVDYRLAPEHKFPAAVEDCYDATKWVAENISSWGGDPNKLIVMGDSAGGNLAAVTAIQARDLGTPKIAYQVLVYPTVDGRMQHPSINENAEGYILTKELMNWFMDNYARTEADKSNPLMSPLLTEDLSNLPPALVQTAQFDPLRDEGIDYAKAIRAAGNEVKHTNYSGLIHTYFTMPKFNKECYSAHEEIAASIKAAVG
ncbi:MAG: alpha/beta hydrolase [Bacteroidota bacterium]